MIFRRLHIPINFIRKAALCLAAGLVWAVPGNAQVIAAGKDTAAAKPVTTYTYIPPANQLMRWPNYPATAEQVQRNLDNNAEKNKLLPAVVNTLLQSKKKGKTAAPPKF